MGFPTYNCSEELAEKFPVTLAQHGIKVTPRSIPNLRHAYRFRRGLGTVHFGSFVEKADEPFTVHLVCSSNPLFWIFDMLLLSRVERTLLALGASPWNPPEKDPLRK